MEISKIQDSISIILGLQLVFEDCFEVIKREKHNENSKIRPAINGLMVIYANSFIEEWENFGAQCKDDNRVIKVRQIANPFIRRIKQWTDLGTARNTILAHNYRDSKGNNVLLKKYDDEGLNVPNSFGDFFVLRGCILIAKEIVVREFAVEYNELLPRLKP